MVSKKLLALGLTALIALVTVIVGGADAQAAGSTTIKGKYVILHADADHEELNFPAIVVGTKTYKLKGRHQFPVRPGQFVTANGALNGQELTVSTISASGSEPAAPTSLSALVILVDWTAPDSTTQAAAQAQYNSTNRTWFANDSYGALSAVTGTATPWLGIAAPADLDGTGPDTPCDNINTIQTEGDSAATAAGYSPGNFTNVVYYYPSCPNERWGGWGQVGGNRTWLIGEMDTRVAVHELGHNFGLNHSHSQTCNSNGITVPFSSTCTMDEYGDPMSAMGAGFSGQGMFAASQQVALGWLGVGTHTVRTVTASGTYTLAPYEATGGGVQALRVTDNTGTEFWIEYRQPIGNDSFLPGGETDGVIIRTADGTYSNLYDMTPLTSGSFGDAALPSGQSWSKPLSNLKVSVGTVTTAGATVTVTLANPGPVLTVAKSGSGTGTVVSTPAGISCGTACTATFSAGTSVTLTAAPATGSTFTGWTGACSGTAPTCTLSMTAAATVTAAFASNSLPDLIVTAVTWSPSTPTTGTAVTFKATINNQGPVATPSGVIHGVGFLVDGTNVAFSDNDTASLAAGASITLTANGSNAGGATWPATRGRHTVKAWVDDRNRIAESNDANNVLSRSLAVYTPTAPSTVAISSGALRAGTVSALSAADGVNYQVNSTTSTTRTMAWSATTATSIPPTRRLD